jgi:hypothetical protein
MVELEFIRSVRVGMQVFNGPCKTEHGDKSITDYPADRAGFDDEMADKLVALGHARVVRRGVPDTAGTGGDFTNAVSTMGHLYARIEELERDNARLRGQ